MGAVFNPFLVSVGKETYGRVNVINFSDKYRVSIGNFCSISTDVFFIVCGEHRVDTISTYPFRVQCCSAEFEATSKGDIIVEDDVWFGHGATVLSGVHIGQGAVISAGAVVTKDVPPYAIVGGVPARIIKYRFSDEMINELIKVDYSKMTTEMIKENIEKLYDKLESKEQLEWLPRK